jgi:hypothetical protein
LICVFTVYTFVSTVLGGSLQVTPYKLLQLALLIFIPFLDYLNYLAVCIGSYYIYFILSTKIGLKGNQKEVLDTILLGTKDLGANEDVSDRPLNLNQQPTTNCTQSLEITNKQVSTTLPNYNDVKFYKEYDGAISLIKDFRTKV